MANITVTFADGSPHTYSNVPDNVTPDQIEQRATQDFAGRKVTHLDRVAGQAVEKPQGMLDQVRDFSVALGHHAANLPHGIAQLVENGVNGAAQLLPDNPVSRGINSIVTSDNAAMAQREKDYQASVPNSAGAYAGAVTGEVAPFAANAVAKPLQAAGSLLERFMAKHGASDLAAKVGSGATQGGLVSAAMPVTDGDYSASKLNQIVVGAPLGGAAPLLVKAAGGVANMGRNIVNPVLNPETSAIEKLVQDAGGTEQAHAAIDRAVAAGNSMSGQPFTLGQAGKNAGLSSTERARSAVNPENFQEIYQAQRAARLRAMQSIGQDDTALENAIATRADNARSNYTNINDQVFPGGDDLTNLLSRARSGGALGEAQKIAGIEGRKFSIPVVEDAVKPEQALLDVVGQAVKGGDLHSVKMGIDQAIGTATGHQKAALVSLKKDFLEWMGNQSPEYLKANAQYASDSRPINQMKIAQKLTDALTGNAYAHGAEPGQAIAGFMKALKNAPSIAKSETGMKQPLSKVMEPEQMNKIMSVAKELAKDVDLQNLGKGVGSDTAQKLARGNAGNMLASVIKVIPYGEAGLKAGSALVKTRVNNQLDKLLQNPEQAKAALSKLSKSEKNKLVQLLESNPLSNQFINSSANAP